MVYSFNTADHVSTDQLDPMIRYINFAPLDDAELVVLANMFATEYNQIGTNNVNALSHYTDSIHDYWEHAIGRLECRHTQEWIQEKCICVV